MTVTKNYINQCEQAEEIQKAWKNKKAHIEDKVYVKHFDEFILVTKEIEFWKDEETNREYITFRRKVLKPIPFTEFDKDAFYKYNDGELNIIYLPTQEQLQEMVLKDYGMGWNMLFCFKDWVDNQIAHSDPRKHKMDMLEYNMNELWLTFVMHEKYHKIWTGEKWVKAE